MLWLPARAFETIYIFFSVKKMKQIKESSQTANQRKCDTPPHAYVLDYQSYQESVLTCE